MSKQTQQLIAILIIGILIGFFAQKLWETPEVELEDDTFSTPKIISTTTISNNITKPATISASQLFPRIEDIPKNLGVGLNVPDQTSGGHVFISGLSLTKNQWIAVYADENGQPAQILGTLRLRAGDVQGDIELLRHTEAGKKYYVAILSDNGDDVFDRLSDLPEGGPTGIVVASFHAN